MLKKSDSDENLFVKMNHKVSPFRRYLPQVLATLIKNLILFIGGISVGLITLIIPSLLGVTTTLKSVETLRITGADASWLSCVSNIGHPIGSFLSGFYSDAFGRRKALMLVLVPILIILIMLSTAQSFWVICLAFFLLSFMLGLKNAASAIYVSEISEKSIRGILLSLTPIFTYSGASFTLLIGSFLTWRQITMVASTLPVAILVAIYFIPETPSWLLSKNRPNDALKSMQWLRGWTSADTVRDEFTSLKNHKVALNACDLCVGDSKQCEHMKAATFWDTLEELKRKRVLKPFILTMILGLFSATSAVTAMSPYIIQVIKAHGIPIDANLMASLLSTVNLVGTFGFMFSVKSFGKRRLYLISATMMVLCCIGLSIYGFVFFPPNWTSFENPAHPNIPDFDYIRNEVGNHGYLALALLIVMNFFTAFGFDNVPVILDSEVFPFRLRSVLCGVTTTFTAVFFAISPKLYYDVELWLTLPGAILSYGLITLFGLIIVYFILPETEGRSLEDIEMHYADDTKKITDIHIPITSRLHAI